MTFLFWQAFEKRADAASGLTGGSGFTGEGKGSLSGGLIKDRLDGVEGAYHSGSDTRTDKTLLDRDRTARTDDPFSTGPEFQDESNPHIRY